MKIKNRTTKIHSQKFSDVEKAKVRRRKNSTLKENDVNIGVAASAGEKEKVKKKD